MLSQAEQKKGILCLVFFFFYVCKLLVTAFTLIPSMLLGNHNPQHFGKQWGVWKEKSGKRLTKPKDV